MRGSVWLAVIALAGLPLVAAQSTVNADERYMVVGRVLDAEGLPAGRVSVRAELIGTPEVIAPQALPTNCEGDVVLVFPIIDLGEGRLRVTIGANSTVHELDPVTRRTHVKLVASGVFATPECEESRQRFPDRHVVTGRLVEADGSPFVGETVNVTVSFAIGGAQSRTATTNQAGDFAVLFQSGRFAQGASPDRATVAWGDRAWEVELDHRFGVTLADQVAEGGGPPWFSLAAGTIVLAAGAVLIWLWRGRD